MINKVKKTYFFLKIRSLYKNSQEKELFALRKNFYSKFLKNGVLVFDVGANTGNRVEVFLALGAAVIAVEPQEFCRKVLKAKFGKKITVVPFGLGEVEEEKTMYISNSNTISSFSKEWIDEVKKDRFKNEEWNKTETIRLTTLDKLIEKHGKPHFIKIDVEGFELQVLKGLSQVVQTISFEYTVPEQLSRAVSCVEHLNSLSQHYLYNYSTGESMDYVLDNFVDFVCFKNTILNSDKFIKSGNGDIYAKIKK